MSAEFPRTGTSSTDVADVHERVSARFLAALDASMDARTPDEQAAWLAEVETDESVRAEVVAMLAQHGAADGLLDTPVFAREAALADGTLLGGTDARIGERIGPWQIEDRLGAGGMGVVYRAVRADGLYDRTVALKLLHPGPDRAALARRFASERRILARLEHIGIARLYDGGVTDEGLPYLALERVDGRPLIAYAATRDLALRARVALFVQVCEAVAYAHRRLVIHRDLKPSNVLVAEAEDATPQVKLLDFGIAKLLEGGDIEGEDDDAVLTRAPRGPMTPAYAAPEQFLGEPATTATDVYALGVLLYELLADARPYDLGALTAAQAERVVCDATPPRPSAVAPPSRARALAGDLDQIVRTAMAREPDRRYASAEALAADLQRYLDGLPVLARPAAAGYLVRKFVSRHRTGVAVAALVVALLAATIGFYTQRLAAERDRAQQAAMEATAHAERAEAIAGFLEQILRAPNRRWYNDAEATGPATPIRAVIDEAAARVTRDFADQPDLRADLHHLLGDTYLALGLGDEARHHHRTVLALRESLYTPPHPKLAEALYYAAWYVSDHPEDWATRTGILRRAVAMQRARNEGNNFPFMVQPLADAYLLAERPAEADSVLAEALDFVTTVFVPGHDGHRYRQPVQAALARDRAVAHLNLDRLDESDRWLTYADSVLGLLSSEAQHLSTWQTQRCVEGRLRSAQQRPSEAERALLACAGVGPPRAPAAPFQPPDVVSPIFDAPSVQASAALVVFYDEQGRPDEAAPYRATAAAYSAQRDSIGTLLRASGVFDKALATW
ncbi:MAG: serine/threonine-protein kinase [Bacteroidota bacterium]